MPSARILRDGWSGVSASEQPDVSSATAPAEAVVGQLPLLGFLPEELRSLVVESFIPLRFGFGETIVREGDAPDGFYVLNSGLARVVKLADDGQEVSLNVLRDGEFFGEAGLLEGAPRSATVRAASEVSCQRLDVAVFMALVRVYPSIGEAFALQTRAQRLSNFLRVHSAFARLPQTAIGPMLTRLTALELEPGELAVREGDPGGPLFIVEEGRLRAFQGRRRGGAQHPVSAHGGFLR